MVPLYLLESVREITECMSMAILKAFTSSLPG